MNRRTTLVLVVCISAMMLFTTSSVFYEEDSDALVQQNGISIDPDHATLYIRAGTGHSMQFTVDKSGIPNTYHNRTVNWYLNDLDNGDNLISFSDTQDVYTSTGNSVTVYGKVAGSIELVAAVAGTSYIASTVIYVTNEPGDPTDIFNFYIKIDGEAMTSAGVGIDVPTDVLAGKWYSIDRTTFYSNTSNANLQFNAWNALKEIVRLQNTNSSNPDFDLWTISGGNTGWIDTFLGLGTYPGTDGSWIYWTQYHAVNGSWVFNDTTMGYMTTAECSEIGLYFRVSQSPTDLPEYPN